AISSTAVLMADDCLEAFSVPSAIWEDVVLYKFEADVRCAAVPCIPAIIVRIEFCNSFKVISILLNSFLRRIEISSLRSPPAMVCRYAIVL
ncbi:MAG: hypothetical protein PHH28_14550, partial [Desulfuromonadaceae bacterium]|nr:hypothetical protein [Desulfuromonadaceae bacterium]